MIRANTSRSNLSLHMRVSALRALGALFPRLPSAHMTAAEQTSRELVKASESMGRYLAAMPGHDIDVLDFGCGWGGETLWLAGRVRSVVGVDVERASIDQAESAATAHQVRNCRFLWSPEGLIPAPSSSFDAVFSTDTFEHVLHLDRAFGEIFRVLRPGGVLLTRFGPLFYSPFGYHLRWACQVPYAHLIFGLDPIITLRNEQGGSDQRVSSWEETGLNRKRYGDFRRAALKAGFQLERFERVPVKGLRLLAHIPLVGDLVTFGVDCAVRKPRD